MRYFGILILITAILGVTGCQNYSPTSHSEAIETSNVDPVEEKNKIVLLFPHGAPEETTTHVTALKFKELIELKSNGEIQVEIYPNDTLGNPNEVEEALRNGTVQVGAGTIGYNGFPELEFLNIPELFPDRQTAIEKLADGPLRELLDEEIEKRGLKLLGIVPNCFRVTSCNKPITSIEDFKNLKIRILNNNFQYEYWEALGAKPMFIPFNEVYSSLQQGIIDAQENPMATIVGAKLYEQQKYIIITNHFMHYNCIFMSKVFFDNLSTEYQSLIKEAMDEVMKFSADYSSKAEKEARKQLINAGIEIIDLSVETQEEIRKKTTQVVNSTYKSSPKLNRKKIAY